MKAQQKSTQTQKVVGHNRPAFEGIGKMLGFRHHISQPVNLKVSFATATSSTSRIEEQITYNLEAERRSAMARTYSNMMPPR